MSNLTTDNTEHKYDRVGKLMGYPKCCIEAFKSRALHGDSANTDLDSVFTFTGYLPCKECAKKDPLELLQVIEENRSAKKQPFPISGDNLTNLMAVMWQTKVGYFPKHMALYQVGKLTTWIDYCRDNLSDSPDLKSALYRDNELNDNTIVCEVNRSELLASVQFIHGDDVKLFVNAASDVLLNLSQHNPFHRECMKDIKALSKLVPDVRINRYVANQGNEFLTVDGKPHTTGPHGYLIKFN